jgi:hypothetical protein
VLHKSSGPPASVWYRKTVYRNWLWFVLKNFPFREIVKLSPFKASLHKNHSNVELATSLRDVPYLFCSVLFDVLHGLPYAIKKRKPVSLGACDYYKVVMANGIR